MTATYDVAPGASRSRLGSALLVLAGASLFGTVGTAQALGPSVPTWQLAAARLLLAALLMAGVVVAVRGFGAVRSVLRHAPVWWAGIGQASFNVCFLAAMSRTGVAVGTLVAIGATPIITGLVTRHVSRRWFAATTVAVTGLVLLVTGQTGAEAGPGQVTGQAQVDLLGVGIALGASASYATFIIAGHVGAVRGLSTQPFLAVAFTVAAVATVPLLFVGDVSVLASSGGMLLVGYLALVPTLLAYSLFLRGLRGVRSSTASTLGLVEPVVAAVLALAVLSERLSPQGLAGAGLVLLGLLLVVRAAARVDEGPEWVTRAPVGKNA